MYRLAVSMTKDQNAANRCRWAGQLCATESNTEPNRTELCIATDAIIKGFEQRLQRRFVKSLSHKSPLNM